MREREQQTIFDSSIDSSLHNYKISADELKEELSKFDLTENQSKVYIFLGKYGSQTAPEVCKALKIARTETYQLLAALQKKGIVLATFGHPIKFSALKLTMAVKTLVNAGLKTDTLRVPRLCLEVLGNRRRLRDHRVQCPVWSG